MWSVVAAKRNVQRQISKAMCTLQPPSAKGKSLGFGLEQKPHFSVQIGIIGDIAPRGLCAQDPEMKTAGKLQLFIQHLMVLLYLLTARPDAHTVGCCSLVSLAPTVTLVKYGLDRDAPQPGENRVTEGIPEGAPRLGMFLRWIPVGHQDAISLPPCMAHGQAVHSGLD